MVACWEELTRKSIDNWGRVSDMITCQCSLFSQGEWRNFWWLRRCNGGSIWRKLPYSSSHISLYTISADSKATITLYFLAGTKSHWQFPSKTSIYHDYHASSNSKTILLNWSPTQHYLSKESSMLHLQFQEPLRKEKVHFIDATFLRKSWQRKENIWFG